MYAIRSYYGLDRPGDLVDGGADGVTGGGFVGQGAGHDLPEEPGAALFEPGLDGFGIGGGEPNPLRQA